MDNFQYAQPCTMLPDVLARNIRALSPIDEMSPERQSEQSEDRRIRQVLDALPEGGASPLIGTVSPLISDSPPSKPGAPIRIKVTSEVPCFLTSGRERVFIYVQGDDQPYVLEMEDHKPPSPPKTPPPSPPELYTIRTDQFKLQGSRFYDSLLWVNNHPIHHFELPWGTDRMTLETMSDGWAALVAKKDYYDEVHLELHLQECSRQFLARQTVYTQLRLYASNKVQIILGQLEEQLRLRTTLNSAPMTLDEAEYLRARAQTLEIGRAHV